MKLVVQRVLLAIHNKEESASNGAGPTGQLAATTTTRRAGGAQQPRSNNHEPAVMPAEMWRDWAETYHELVGTVGMGVERSCLVHQTTLRSSHNHNSAGRRGC